MLQSHDLRYSPQGTVSSSPTSPDPLNVTGSPHAFNYSYSQANLYTNSSKSPPLILPLPNATSGTQFRWLSTVTRTTNNTLIPTSGFRFNITTPPPASQGRQQVNWTLTIPQFNCKNCTSVEVLFDFFGNITRGTNATYTLFNGTNVIQSQPFVALGSFPIAGTALCPEIFCIPVTRYIGFKLTLSFIFAWNGTELPGMSADVGEIEVASIGNRIPSCASSCHFMQQDPSNSTSIIHTTNLSSVIYNNTLTTFVQPGNVSTTQPWWNIEAISIYYPVGYNVTQIKLNSTQVYSLPSEVPLEKDHCAPGTACTESLIALNITDFTPRGAIHNSTMTIISTTTNSVRQLTTQSAGVPTRFFTSGDQIGINVLNHPSVVNASIAQQTGQLNITFSQPLSIQPSETTTLSGGVFSFTLPADCGSNGGLCSKTWNVTAVFSSGFDLGIRSAFFGINSLQVSFTSSTGGSNALSVQGLLTYGNGTKAPGINATLFAIDRGTPVNRPITTSQTSFSSGLLYISNVTLVDGIFTQGQSLIMLFTVVDPNPTQAYNATVTIEHDWPGPQRHNMTVPVFLGLGDGLGDLAFTNATSRAYEAAITFTGTGVQVVVTSLSTGNPSPKPLSMTSGTTPVVPNRPHAGLFNITITSKIGNTTQTPSNSILSAQYAYVASSLVPSRYLLGSSVIQTDSNGGFSTTISSTLLLGAKDLTVFILARDATGVGLVNNLSNIGFTDSTVLFSTTDSIGPVAKGQTATATLHLRSNSTKLTEIITVNLILQGNGILAQTVATQTGVTVAPGASQTVILSFTAPSNTGLYTLTFSSPEYGGPLTSLTLQVTILQTNLQILIPTAIGIVAAIIILGIYLIKRQPETVESAEKTKPTGSKPKNRGSGTPPSKSLT
jgi:hypothetical protein